MTIEQLVAIRERSERARRYIDTYRPLDSVESVGLISITDIAWRDVQTLLTEIARLKRECAKAYEDEITTMMREYANTPLTKRKDGSAVLWELHERVGRKVPTGGSDSGDSTCL